MLSWDASSVPVGGFVTGYAIFVDGEQVATTTGTSYRVTGLTADTDYHFSVAAIDGAGPSELTSAITVHTTLAPPPGDDGHMFSPYIDMAMSNAADLAGISAASGITNFTLAFVLPTRASAGRAGAASTTIRCSTARPSCSTCRTSRPPAATSPSPSAAPLGRRRRWSPPVR
jgi:chitinase